MTGFERTGRTQLTGADRLIEHRIGAGLGFVSCLYLLGALFHPWAAQLPVVSPRYCIAASCWRSVGI